VWSKWRRSRLTTSIAEPLYAGATNFPQGPPEHATVATTGSTVRGMVPIQLPVETDSVSFSSGGLPTHPQSDEELLVGLLEVCRDIASPRASVRIALRAQGRLPELIDGIVTPEAVPLQTVVWLASEVARRVAAGRAARRQLARPADVAAVATCELAGAERERLLLLVCDAGNKLLHMTVITEGTADRLLLPVREILAFVLQRGGRGFAVAHNHPSGDTTASQSDLAGTRALTDAARVVGLRSLGHVIVAGEEWQAVGSGEVREGGVDG
jgi:DNA repair protein RadC